MLVSFFPEGLENAGCEMSTVRPTPDSEITDPRAAEFDGHIPRYRIEAVVASWHSTTGMSLSPKTTTSANSPPAHKNHCHSDLTKPVLTALMAVPASSAY